MLPHLPMAIAHDITSAFAKPDTLIDDWQQIGSSEEWEPGLRIGPYRLKQRLGKGGMGVVWLAEQLQPLQREVALKVMAAEGRDGLAETWFEIERQALAQLSHPCVAQIFDAGRLPDGALFFAMEFVPGLPLDEFQAQHRLDWRALATLFMRICAGVQHAHQRGLIHRDLKPLNVLVRLLDGVPAPKIIDFGIAVSALTGVAAPFRVDRVIGTPAYMSLEQRSPGPQGIDARCDIYALGVMLGEALARAGGEPIERDGLDVSAVQDAVRLELGQPAFDPARDSAALRARLRHCPRELLAIALKAMAVDREQRYESAAAMAEDLGRWLERRPVRAVGNARLYLLRCVVRRNRMASLAVALVLAAILAGSAMAWYGMNEARAAQALAEQRRDDAERLIQYMLGDFADKLRPIGRLDLLDSIGKEALAYLGAEHAGGDASSVLSRARALRTLGEVQVTRQQLDLAARTLESGAGLLSGFRGPAEPPPEYWLERGTITFWQGTVSYRRKDFASAEHHWRAYLTDAERFASLAQDDPRGRAEVASALNNLGTLAREQGRLDEALEYFRRSAAIKRALIRDPMDGARADLANSLAWIANVHAARGETAEAWHVASDALEIVVSMGAGDPSNGRLRQREVNMRYMLADYAQDLGDIGQAAAILRPALDLAREDVASDPTQPRRQAMLARVGFSLARLAFLDSRFRRQALALADSALAAVAADALSDAERLELNLLQCLARVVDADEPVGRLQIWQSCAPALLGEPSATDRSALGLQFALVNEILDIAPVAALPFVPAMNTQFEATVAADEQSLYALSMRWMLARTTGRESEISRGRLRLDEAREQVSIRIEELEDSR